MLGSFAYENVDLRWVLRMWLRLHNGLDRISEQLSHNILQMAQNIWKSRLQMTLEAKSGICARLAVHPLDELNRPIPTIFNDLFGITSKKNFSDEFCIRIGCVFGIWEVPGRIERFC